MLDVSNGEDPPKAAQPVTKSVTYPEMLSAKAAAGKASTGERALLGEADTLPYFYVSFF